MSIRKKFAMVVAEFLGTGILTLVVLAVQRSTIGIPYFIAIAAGLTVGALSLVFGKISGGYFNPAITFGAFVAGRIKPLIAFFYLVAQLLGGWLTYFLYTYFVNSSFPSIGGHYKLSILVAEAVGAFIFAIGWAAVAAQKLSGAVAGAALTLGILIASIAAAGIVNPAVALGTRAWAGFGSVGWAYFFGPMLGALLGFVLYELVFADTPFGGWATAPAFAGSSPVVVPTLPVVSAAPARKTTAAKATTTKAKKAPAKKK